ncbi:MULTISPECIES: sulfurtransferase complex subunit TusC [unclassified Colwellia]|mgnify:CR=1 FL=1|uniref:sulfurtransferase complex subunit TusC n=1 Tax=unclassified Colwellia TaxID=196834 RepID=UPI0015F6E3F4|nr:MULTISPECIES: sulfurtransferase complex subunit TusC [unclassified Colwellia]MBA6346668.1 sulfurtransferase complex subunit TusC [Colwellia sp. BRX8-9]MBA6353485.1 sulfurtransferase complex subunit TusC [Colwellia sp. BRX9-1]MBA6356264.1 sulfurtransferase complex subunit TusC [Colwellia sp. BRX8-3]MBA6360091.1 sulfurtransferase complex subunit TusC [Colwellia sp. BRX8-6]MBA6369602.1 sulfurtransferase complex subunit TusC [Colwellia sp. BRX8-5]
MSEAKKSLAIVNASAPFSAANAKDSLDVALIFGSYEQAISLYFQGDGVYQLIPKQQPEFIQQKDFLKTLAALEFYDIENIYVCQHSLTQRGLANDFSIENVAVLDRAEFSISLHQHQSILRF